MALSNSLPQINLGVQGDSNSGAKRINPEFRVGSNFRIIPEQYFSEMENVAKESIGMPEEQRSTGINSLPQNSLRERSLSMDALDGDPADRSE
ncbi:hypothetical protein TNCV_498031 [Trichonephila clavipes]|nr:hypothetical protein TNCV_498031 [Trichonephila clavipes]